MTPFSSLLERIKGKDWYAGQIVSVVTLPGQDARYASPAKPLPKPIERYLAHKGIQLYTHQARAIDLIRDGHDVFITTPTASGKTLAFNLPVLERLMDDPEATALYLFPLKALTNDQLVKLRELEREIKFPVQAYVYDGDTPTHARARIRAMARILLTNPYALHQYLPWHAKWSRFLKRLAFIVIDEAHQYRGVFGTHVALLIRRLRRIVSRYGADPKFILSSATIANPEEFGERLLGRPVEVVSEDGAPHGPRTFVFWNPLLTLNRSVTHQVSDLLSLFIEEGLQTLCFTTSRRMAEVIATMTQAKVHGHRIMAYRAGYLPGERREIESGLRDRTIDGVVSTNALELGMDIGGLDVVAIAGYPGTVISVWQQAGRAGRGREPSLVIVIGFEDPLDQYFLAHPADLLTRPHEHAIIDPENEPILARHLLCASAEFPLREEASFVARNDLLYEMQNVGLVAPTPAGWVFQGRVPPVEIVSLNNLSERTVRIERDGELLETMDYERALREAHPGAVLLHQGDTYVVRDLDLELGVARCVREDVDYYTEPQVRSDVRVLRKTDSFMAGKFRLTLGDVRVSEQVVGYRVRRGGVTLGMEHLDLPPVEFDTEGLWIEVPDDMVQEVRSSGRDWPGGLHGAEHALVAIAPLYAMTDRWDLGGVSTPYHPDLARPAIIVYEAFPQGVGIVRKLFQVAKEWCEAGMNLVRDCRCESGCPSCVLSPRCGNENQPMDKQAAFLILSVLTQALQALA